MFFLLFSMTTCVYKRKVLRVEGADGG